jgi:hypothetical protein
MNIRNTVRTLAVAALLATTIVSVSAGQADAKPIGDKQKHGPVKIDDNDPYKLCAIQGYAVNQPQYDWVFYSSGDIVNLGGTIYSCASGKWVAFK